MSDSDEQDGNKDEGQDDDSEEIDDSLLKHCRGAHLSALYVRTFFRTMRREWGNVDKHRIERRVGGTPWVSHQHTYICM